MSLKGNSRITEEKFRNLVKMKDYRVIAIFTYPSEYTILKHLLELNNIQYVFENETMISVLPFHSNAIGGIRLKVHWEDELAAREILNNLNNPSNLRIV